MAEDRGAELADYVAGTSMSLEQALEMLGLWEMFTVEGAEETLLDMGIERCPECDCWVESGELVDDDGEPCPCSSCR